MPQPNPHALRRFLFFGNFVLLALLLTLAGLLVAAPTQASSAQGHADVGEDVRSAWEQTRGRGLRWSPDSPVSDREFDGTFRRYQDHPTPHYPFVGPLPSTKRPAASDPDLPTPPSGLDALGTIAMLIVGQGEPTVSFTFTTEPRVMVHITPGEFFRRSPEETGRFRLARVVTVAPRLHHVHYDVVRDGAIERTAYLIHDGRVAPEPQGPFRPEPEDRPPSKPRVRQIHARAPRHFTPTIHADPQNARRRVVALDEATHSWGRKAGVAEFLSRIKTAPAVDPATKAPLGIRLTGFAADLPADRFDVRRGDILVSVAGKNVTSRAELLAIARSLDPTELIPLVIDRRGTLLAYRVDARDPLTRRKIVYFDLPESK